LKEHLVELLGKELRKWIPEAESPEIISNFLEMVSQQFESV
jgi:hypothetical protein